jgi:hypothetical protein
MSVHPPDVRRHSARLLFNLLGPIARGWSIDWLIFLEHRYERRAGRGRSRLLIDAAFSGRTPSKCDGHDTDANAAVGRSPLADTFGDGESDVVVANHRRASGASPIAAMPRQGRLSLW